MPPASSVLAAKVFWASQPVEPNDTVLVSAGNIDSAVAVEAAPIPDIDGSSPLNQIDTSAFAWSTRAPLQASQRSVKFTLPATWRTGLYAFRLNRSGESGSVNYLNRPDIWFVQGDRGGQASPGGWLQVHGVALALAGSNRQPALALVRNGVVAATLHPSVDPLNNGYRQRFLLPTTLAAGDYQVFVHNGHGGSAGWTRYSAYTTSAIDSITVTGDQPWPSSPYTVASQTGASDESRLRAAIAAAGANGGGIVVLPNGTITLTAPLLLPNHVLIRGTSKTASLLLWADSYTGPGPLVSGVTVGQSDPVLRSRFSIEDLSIQGGAAYTGAGIEVHHLLNGEFSYLRRVSITLPYQASLPNSGYSQVKETGISLRQIRNVEITDTDIRARDGVTTLGNVQQLYMARDQIQWRHASMFLQGGTWANVIENNVLTYSGPASGNNDEYTIDGNRTADNPGFWLTMFSVGVDASKGAHHNKGVYYGNNTHKLDHPAFRPCTNDPLAYPYNIVGWTTDGANGIYFGGVSAVAGTTVTLAGNTRPADAASGERPYDWTGGALMVVSGTGAGQQRVISHAYDSSSTVTIDHPFDVVPDSSSVIMIGDELGQLLRVKNDFGYDCTNQDYFLQSEHVMADNNFSIGGWLAFHGKHYKGYSIGQRVQLLGNTLANGTDSFTDNSYAPQDFPAGYAGPGIAFEVYRNNRVASGGATPSITVRASATVPTMDILIERNSVSGIQLGRSRSEPLNHQGIVIRNNTGARLTGNLSGVNLTEQSWLYYEP